MHYSATYSPEDNKLRLSASSRLDAETYARVKAAGFSWAPKQGIFVAPMWTPSREDLMLEMCGEIDDEDTTLVDRAEDRAERFDGYKENRISDAEQARAAVSRIADNIPFGQPILVGHHSERHARKDAQRIENGMRRTVQMWSTAKYWEQRAAGALHHAKYKALPGVRHRRIKGLEADLRKDQRSRDEAEKSLATWEKIAAIEDKEKQHSTAVMMAGSYGERVLMPRKEGDRPDFDQRPSVYDALRNSHPTLYAPRTIDEVFAAIREALPRRIAHDQRWIDHYTNRIAYEKAMMGESGGLAADKFAFEIGGKVLVGDEWLVILKINKTGEALSSLTTTPRRYFYGSKYKADIEAVKDYQAPAPEETAAVKAATKLPPMCNYPGEGFAQMTQAEFTAVYKDSKGSDVIKETETTGKHRRRRVDNFIARRHGAAAGSQWGSTPVFLTDAKRVDPPTKQPPPLLPEPSPREFLEEVAADLKAMNPPQNSPSQQIYAEVAKNDPRIPDSSTLWDMEKAAKAGVQVVTAPQLFPTPPELAARMVELAEIEPEHRVLEPSVGTGNIAKAIFASAPVQIVAVELNLRLADAFQSSYQSWNNSRIEVVRGDFLEQNGNLGKFDRILMNPPFVNGDDIKHILHAITFLKPGGRLVAICAGGPRQENRLMPICDSWEPLPAGTFKDSGTGVNTVLLTITKEAL